AAPMQIANRTLQALHNGHSIRLAGKVTCHRAPAVGESIAVHGNFLNRPAGAAEADTARGSADGHRGQRSHRDGCPAPVPGESASAHLSGAVADRLDAPTQAGRGSWGRFPRERPGEIPLQGQLAPAASADAQVFLDRALLLAGQLAVGEWRNQLLEPRMLEGSFSHRDVPVACHESPSESLIHDVMWVPIIPSDLASTVDAPASLRREL